VDCHSLKGADSTCLALLLHLQSRLSKPLKVVGLPDELRVLVDLYGLQELLELA
jgi:phospholipid transport system transporter-binding protein